MKLESFCDELEIDMQKSLARFAGNAMLYVRFLKKFADDSTFNALKHAVEQETMEAVEREAHTLKGISLNLGLNRLGMCADKVVKAVREGNYAEVRGLFDTCGQEYEKVREHLSKLE